MFRPSYYTRCFNTTCGKAVFSLKELVLILVIILIHILVLEINATISTSTSTRILFDLVLNPTFSFISKSLFAFVIQLLLVFLHAVVPSLYP